MSNDLALYNFIGAKIKELRTNYCAKGIKQEKLAAEIEVNPNTISRWETATYKPTARDLEKLADFFKVSISVFFPQKLQAEKRLAALARATGDLPDEDIKELIKYAEFRRARSVLEENKK